MHSINLIQICLLQFETDRKYHRSKLPISISSPIRSQKHNGKRNGKEPCKAEEKGPALPERVRKGMRHPRDSKQHPPRWMEGPGDAVPSILQPEFRQEGQKHHRCQCQPRDTGRVTTNNHRRLPIQRAAQILLPPAVHTQADIHPEDALQGVARGVHELREPAHFPLAGVLVGSFDGHVVFRDEELGDVRADILGRGGGRG
ncbi:hypothetical protein BDW62DRAFT_188952 [Aspergillus aurantiobrunneus]